MKKLIIILILLMAGSAWGEMTEEDVGKSAVLSQQNETLMNYYYQNCRGGLTTGVPTMSCREYAVLMTYGSRTTNPKEPECRWETKSKRFGGWNSHGVWYRYSTGTMEEFLNENKGWEPINISYTYKKSEYSNIQDDDYMEVWLKRKVCE